MAKLVAGMASSHAYTFYPIESWEERRAYSRQRFGEVWGPPPPEQPQIERETLEDNQLRFGRVKEGLQKVKHAFDLLNADALILLGDDQNENYVEHIPQIAIYGGERFVSYTSPLYGPPTEHLSDPVLAEQLLSGSVEAGFDVTWERSFPEDRLRSHAHTQILSFLKPTIPVVLVFINGIHPPAPSPMRCYQFGQCLGQIIDALPNQRRVAVYASGGFSHFSASFPFNKYSGPYTIGSISEEFDRTAAAAIEAGRGADLAKISSQELLDNGGHEMRQWIALLGAVNGGKPDYFAYEPFYRAIMGLEVGYWGQPHAALAS